MNTCWFTACFYHSRFTQILLSGAVIVIIIKQQLFFVSVFSYLLVVFVNL